MPRGVQGSALAGGESISIPFARGRSFGREQEYVGQVMERGLKPEPSAFVERCSAALEQRFIGARVLPTTSCTAALEMCALLLELREGDEVIVPSFTFVATASAFALHGATLVFADTDPVTLGLAVADITRRITPRTRAVVCMHYGAAGRDIIELVGICEERGIVFIEDNAHGMLAELDGRPLGSYGGLAVTSFHFTKPVSCGQGGALIVNDRCFAERAQVLLNRGTNLEEYLGGRVDAYRWVDHGSSFGLSELAAAYLLGQIEALDAIEDQRRGVHARYIRELGDWSERSGIRLVRAPEGCLPGCSPLSLITPDHATREALRAHLGACGIDAPFHYLPLHASPMGRKYASLSDEYPVATRLGECLLRLPIHNALTKADQEQVIDATIAFA